MTTDCELCHGESGNDLVWKLSYGEAVLRICSTCFKGMTYSVAMAYLEPRLPIKPRRRGFLDWLKGLFT